MSDHERGAYTPPTDAPLAFEARQPVRGARPFPITLVVSVLVLLGLAAAIFVFYRSGVRQAAGPPQVVGTPIDGMKAAAPPDAQPQDSAAGLEIYRSENGTQPQMVPTPPQFTPPPEQPQARPQGGPPVVVTPPAQASALPAAPPATTPVGKQELRPAQNPPPPAAQAPASKPAAAPAAPAPAKVAAATLPPKAAEKPAQKATEKPAEKPKPAAVAEKARAKPAATAGSAAVQIGAVSSPALADKTWTEAVAVAPGLAAGKGKGVEKVDKDGKTLYRTSVTGFASKADAAAFCAKLKAAGKACFVK